MVTAAPEPETPATTLAVKPGTTLAAPGKQGAITLAAAELRANLAGRDPEQIEALEWLRHHCVTRGLTWDDAGRRLHKPNGSVYSRDSVYQAMTGVRGLDVSLASLCAAVARYRRNVESPVPDAGFLRTRLYEVIQTQVQRVCESRAMTFIVGANACGKTTAINEIERGSRGRILKVLAKDGHRGTLLRDLARRRGLGDRQTIGDLSDRLVDEFRGIDVLIIDEAEAIFGGRSSLHTTHTFRFVRTLFDEAGCAIVFVLDPSGYKKFQTVGESDPLRKIYSRRIAPLFLPKFFVEDLDLFARRYKLEPAPDHDVTVEFEKDDGGKLRHTDNPRRVQDAICGSHKDGLFVWTSLLREAAGEAERNGRKITWGAVLKAHALFSAMESEVVK